MRRIVRVTTLGLLALLCSAGSCQDKGAVVDSLLSHSGRLRKDPISEPMLYTRDFPGIHNPFAPAGINTRFDIYARRNIALGDPLLYSHDLHALGLACYDDGPSGLTPTLIADQVWTIPSDGTFGIDLYDWLTSENFTSTSPEYLRCRLRGAGTLDLAGKKALKDAVKTIRDGRDPWPVGAGIKTAFAMKMTSFDRLGGSIFSEDRFFFDAFGNDALD